MFNYLVHVLNLSCLITMYYLYFHYCHIFLRGVGVPVNLYPQGVCTRRRGREYWCFFTLMVCVPKGEGGNTGGFFTLRVCVPKGEGGNTGLFF